MSLLLLGVSRPESSFVLDVMGVGAEVAYGFRKLRAAYAGSAFRVREAGGNTETDIGFLANGDLDTTALLNFCGISNGYVVTWYDQSGNGRNVTQPTASSQPIIVNPANPDPVFLLGGKPTAVYDGANTFLRIASVSATMLSVNSVAMQSATGISCVFAAHNNNVSGTQWFFRTDSANILQIIKTATLSSAAVIDTVSRVYTGIANNGTNSELFRDGSSLATGTTLGAGATNGQMNIGASPIGGRFLNGRLSEVLIFPSSLTTVQRQSMERNQGAYFGITVA